MRRFIIKKIILEDSKNNENIIYGARSIQKHLKGISRTTQDYDIFSNNPKKNAKIVERKIDKAMGFNYAFTKKAMHPGTYKVKSLGPDRKPNTKDDEEIVDYTKLPNPQPKTVIYGGVRYRALSEEIKSKRKSISDKNFSFRHPKDKQDLDIIGTVSRSNNPKRPRIPNFFKDF